MDARSAAIVADPAGLRLRRRTAVAVFVLLIIVTPLATAIILPRIVARAVHHGNAQMGWFADDQFRRLISEGAVRPAKPAEVRLWLRQAAAAGNDEVQQYRSSFIAQSFVALRPVDLPNGMFGAHSRVFIVPEGGPMPRDPDSSHNTMLFLGSGTCAGSYPGCAAL